MTLFTIHYSEQGSPRNPANHYAYATIDLRNGVIAGGGYFASATEAREVAIVAYMPYCCEVDAAAYRAARDVCQQAEAVLG